MDYAIFSGDTEEEEKFWHTGIIPKSKITKAIIDINSVINDLVSDQLLHNNRFLDHTGQQKAGFEIYQLLQQPSSNMIHNIVYLNEQVFKIMLEKPRNELSLFRWRVDPGRSVSGLLLLLNRPRARLCFPD